MAKWIDMEGPPAYRIEMRENVGGEYEATSSYVADGRTFYRTDFVKGRKYAFALQLAPREGVDNGYSQTFIVSGWVLPDRPEVLSHVRMTDAEGKDLPYSVLTRVIGAAVVDYMTKKVSR